MDYYSAIKKEEILPFATTWMNSEGIMLSEITQSEKEKYHIISLICRILRKEERSRRFRKLVVARGEG